MIGQFRLLITIYLHLPLIVNLSKQASDRANCEVLSVRPSQHNYLNPDLSYTTIICTAPCTHKSMSSRSPYKHRFADEEATDTRWYTMIELDVRSKSSRFAAAMVDSRLPDATPGAAASIHTPGFDRRR